MGKAKNKKPPEAWETAVDRHFVRIYEDMLESEAFMDLKGRQVKLYLYMKAQYRGKETKNNPYQKKEYFYFSWRSANKRYKLYTNQRSFYDDIKILCESGFIKVIENNKNLRQKNVYAFSDKWKAKSKKL